jgi:hypothetical protein
MRRALAFLSVLVLFLGAASPTTGAPADVREKGGYELVSLQTFAPPVDEMEIGTTYTTWRAEFITREDRNANGTTLARHFVVWRGEVWLLAPGQVRSRMTLAANGEAWDMKVTDAGGAGQATGTVSLWTCAGCEVTSGVMEVTATAIETSHVSGLVPTDPPSADSIRLNSWDNRAIGQVTLDGVVIAAGLPGRIHTAKFQLVEGKP